jgi:hypothetical protein
MMDCDLGTYDLGKVTAEGVERVWAHYGTGEQLRSGFAAWLAEEMNKDKDPPLSELVMTAVLKYFPQCTSLRGCSGCPPWPAAAAQPLEELSTSKLTWVSLTFVEWPDPVNVAKPWQPYRWRAVGVRSDGEVYQAVAYVNRLDYERCGADLLKRVKAAAYAELDKQSLNPEGPK